MVLSFQSGGDLALGETRSRGFFKHGMRLLVLGVLPNISSNIVGYRRDIVNLDARPGTADINPLSKILENRDFAKRLWM